MYPPIAAICGSVAALSLTFSTPAEAFNINGFQGQYDPSNWKFTNTNADGFVNTTDAPNSISLTGGNQGSGFGSGTTDYTIDADADGTVTFNWNYSTADLLTSNTGSNCSNLPNNFCDPFSVLVNGSSTILLSTAGGTNQNGTYNFSILAGQNFGFRIATADNRFGAGSVTISNFSAPATPVPFESNALPVVGATLFMAGGVWCKRKLAKKGVYLVDSHHKE